ncbi:hypothetical protein C8R45DRAFT_1179917 [Mycena sanguinolenta]|nr:hypothetical protein C8R45DRAFT_1179917 [Mycena sanguinolenta]
MEKVPFSNIHHKSRRQRQSRRTNALSTRGNLWEMLGYTFVNGAPDSMKTWARSTHMNGKSYIFPYSPQKSAEAATKTVNEGVVDSGGPAGDLGVHFHPLSVRRFHEEMGEGYSPECKRSNFPNIHHKSRRRRRRRQRTNASLTRGDLRGIPGYTFIHFRAWGSEHGAASVVITPRSAASSLPCRVHRLIARRVHPASVHGSHYTDLHSRMRLRTEAQGIGGDA